ncbi:hypothetical protein A7K50_03270 [Dehalobacter sp. MCB1]|uniref:M23 family metallopeptidase n=1 Tax=Dehalobacter sp. MCB1 TaxID=1844756 RepID=UPI000E6D315F|nr:M23 family metallopeptidase [Dehalobacter sp. MCB1]RJE47682.1 hypothetical protein A7K50_03270 [Dehalobacter sp. MCB1]
MIPMKDATITKCYKELPGSNITYRKGYHTGVDLISTDYNIYAALSGTVIRVYYDAKGWGKYVILRVTACNGKQYDLIHAHCDKQYVKEGQKVTEGFKFGFMGATGQVTGAHLHFEVREVPWTNGKDIDPCVFLGIKNERGKVMSTSSAKVVIPTGNNITPFKSGNGWLEDLPERTIAHQDAYNYICFWKDGRVTEHKRNQPIVEWK